jgi:hypothetical protein
VRRIFVGAVIVLAGVSILVGASVTWFPYPYWGWLLVTGITATSAGGLLLGWSWSALGSRLGRIVAVSTPGAFVAGVSFVAEHYLWRGGSLGEMPLVAAQTYGALWVFLGPPLVLWVRQNAPVQDELPVAPGDAKVSRNRMTRFEKWLLIVTAFPGFTSLLAVVLAQWIK